MGRRTNFTGEIRDYLGPGKEEEETVAPDDFSLPPEREAYYKGVKEAAAHREAADSLKGEARRQYLAGLEEGIRGDTPPKRGDAQNPRIKDMPKEPRQPRAGRQPRPGAEIRRAQANARHWSALARKARGRRR